jgi:hypothetical protein
VLSVPPPDTLVVARQENVVGPRPLSGATVTSECDATPGSTKRLLAVSGPDGAFHHAEVGFWDSGCVLEFASGDGSHDVKRLRVDDLCRQKTGDDHCLRIDDVTVDLVRRGPQKPPATLNFTTMPVGIDLFADDRLRCRSPCSTKLPVGLHRLEFVDPKHNASGWRNTVDLRGDVDVRARYESRASLREAGGWFLVPVVAATILLPIGLARKNEALLWTSAGLGAGGLVGFFVLFRPDRVEVRTSPGISETEPRN